MKTELFGQIHCFFRYDLVLDQDGVQYTASGFKASIEKLLPQEFNDFTDSGLTDLFFGKEVKIFTRNSKYEDKTDTILKIELI